MSNFFYPFLISLIAGLSTLLGTIFIFIKYKNVNKFISMSLSFSAFIMILISIFDLIPSSVLNIFNKYKYFGFVISSIAFIIGFLVIKICNKMVGKLEKEGSGLYKVGLLSIIVLIMHNIPEGVITFISSSNNIELGIKIAIAITLHNIPEGISIAVPIYYSTNSYKKAVGYTLLSGLSEPFAAIITYLFFYKYITINIINIIFIIVAGIMITLAIDDIFKESINYSNNRLKSVFIGIILALILFILSIIFL